MLIQSFQTTKTRQQPTPIILKRKRAADTASERKTRKMNAVRQKQQKEEQLQQSNSRVEAEAEAKAIATEACNKVDEKLMEIKRL